MDKNDIIILDDQKFEKLFIGTLILYSVSELKIKWQEVKDLFTQFNLPESFLPRKIHIKDAFRKAKDEAIANKKPLSNNCYLNLIVRQVYNDDQKLIFHIVREVVDSDNRKLEYKPVISLELDGDTFSIVNLVHDVKPEEEQAAKAVEIELEVQKDCYSGKYMRDIIQRILNEYKPITMRSSGGAYFIPIEFEKQVQNVGGFIKALKKYTISSNSGEKSAYCSIPVVNAKEQCEQIAESVEDQVKGEIKELFEKMDSILASSTPTKPKTADNIINDLRGLSRKVEEYEKLLEIDIFSVKESMNIAMEQALKVLDKASEKAA